jgi:hypothetical protein
MPSDDRTTRLILLCVVFVLLSAYPLLSIADRIALAVGLPLLYVYLFSIWLLLIGGIAWLVRSRKSNNP